jgi:hypothetical protein
MLDSRFLSGGIMLPEDEERQLREIEQALYRDDPKFRRRMRTSDPQVRYKRKLIAAQLGFVIGVGLLPAGAVTHRVYLAAVGVVIVLLSSAWAAVSLRQYMARVRPLHSRAETKTTNGTKHQLGQTRRAQVMKRMEERRRRRQEGNGGMPGRTRSWYPSGSARAPGVFCSIEPAWNDQNLRELAGHISSHLFFAHIRAAIGSAVQQTNCHPFRHDRWLFMHNGFIDGFATIKRDLVLAVDESLFPEIRGTADTEVLFYLALTFGLEDDPPDAVARAIGLVEACGRARGVEYPFQGTIATSDGESL